MLKFNRIVLLGGLLLSLTIVEHVSAQTDSTVQAPVNSPAGGSRKFFMPGNAVVTYQSTTVKGSPPVGSFAPIGISLFPLVKMNDRIFLDGGINFTVNPDLTVGTNLIELAGYYKITPWMSAFFGNFAPHYGIYLGILDDFTNRFGTGVGPVGMGYGPQNQNGIGLQGGVQAGYSKFSYQLYVANGPELIVDSTTVGSGNTTGMMNYGTFTNFNKNKAFGGHIGYLPFSNSSLELTVSGYYAPNTGVQGSLYEKVNTSSLALGLNYYHIFNPIMVRVIAEYDMTQTKNINYPQSDSTIKSPYKFDNKLSGWFAGITVRPTGSKIKVIKNMEAAARIGAFMPPADALWGGKPTQHTTFTLTQYLTWDIPLSLEYDILKQEGSPDKNVFSATIFFRF
jgi:hypothetical protein